MKFRLAIKTPADLERLKELMHTHPLRSDSLNEIAKPIFSSREEVDSYWGDYVPKDYPYVFLAHVEDGIREGGFGEGHGHHTLRLIPISGSHSFDQLDRIKEILECEEYIKVCKEVDTRAIVNWRVYRSFEQELEDCMRGGS